MTWCCLGMLAEVLPGWFSHVGLCAKGCRLAFLGHTCAGIVFLAHRARVVFLMHRGPFHCSAHTTPCTNARLLMRARALDCKPRRPSPLTLLWFMFAGILKLKTSHAPPPLSCPASPQPSSSPLPSVKGQRGAAAGFGYICLPAAMREPRFRATLIRAWSAHAAAALLSRCRWPPSPQRPPHSPCQGTRSRTTPCTCPAAGVCCRRGAWWSRWAAPTYRASPGGLQI